MPRGKYVNHKGRNRHFTTQEELENESSSENESAAGSGESDDGSSSEEEINKDAKKGVAGLIEIENPNRVTKAATKLKNLTLAEGGAGAAPKPELSRREREELQKQQNAARYEKLHAAGKTDEAKADLARLAIIRQQRADAAKQREAAKAAAKAAK